MIYLHIRKRRIHVGIFSRVDCIMAHLVTAHVLQAGEGSWVVRLLLGTPRDRPSRVHALEGSRMHCTMGSGQ